MRVRVCACACACTCAGTQFSEVSIELRVCVCVSCVRVCHACVRTRACALSPAGLHLQLPFSRPPRFQSPSHRRRSSGGEFVRAGFIARARAFAAPGPTGTAFGHKRRSTDGGLSGRRARHSWPDRAHIQAGARRPARHPAEDGVSVQYPGTNLGTNVARWYTMCLAKTKGKVCRFLYPRTEAHIREHQWFRTERPNRLWQARFEK